MSAKEPFLAILNGVYSNGMLRFSYDNFGFFCKPYGISVLEDIYGDKRLPKNCTDELNLFYRQSPLLKYFSLNNLHLKQTYHLEYKNNSCLVYSNGKKTLSELLVEEGLATKQKYLDDKEFNYKLDNAQKRAIFRNKGLHKNTILRNCMLYF
ncbi:MAG: hypothetical protein JXQ66_01045 [Campylobacterales bacterium]|nr:hypothetical protein [Campylobacterales bacterium]